MLGGILTLGQLEKVGMKLSLAKIYRLLKQRFGKDQNLLGGGGKSRFATTISCGGYFHPAGETEYKGSRSGTRTAPQHLALRA